jgi:hypothetical protein
MYDHSMRPEWLAKILDEGYGISSLLRLSEPQYGMLIHERIGAIDMKVDGRLLKEFDIGSAFAALMKIDNSGTMHPTVRNWLWGVPEDRRVTHFVEWWKNALRARIQRGLPVGSATREDRTPPVGGQ